MRFRSSLRLFLAALPALLLFVAARAQDAVQTTTTDWAVIQSPKSVSTDVPFEVKVDLKGVKEKTKLGVDLHWMYKDGRFGGFLTYGGRRDVDKDGSHTFRFKIGAKEGMATAHPVVFLAPDGDFARKTHDATGAAMQVTVTEASLRNAVPKDITYKKSWIGIVPPEPGRTYREGDEFEVTVEYYLDPSENWGDGTRLVLNPMGPWIDNPDGKYTDKRFHANYPGIGSRAEPVAPGRGTQKFRYKVGKVFRYNSLLLIANFRGADGKDWPWQVRASGPDFRYESRFYDLTTDRPGSLFVYDEPVRVRIAFREGAARGEGKTLKYRLVDVHGAEAGAGVLPFTAGAPGETAELTLPVKGRGTFLVETDVDGWGAREMVLARIPDVRKIVGTARTPFGATSLHTDAENRIARMLGFTYCRHFFSWKAVQPGRDHWSLGAWDTILQNNKASGIVPWLCIYDPPAWAQAGPPVNVGYEPFPFDEAGWRDSVDTMTRRWKDRIWGWEWLNEIVPGSRSANPVADYLRLAEIGTETVRKIDPNLKIQMAGGLWPRNFRMDLLRAGVGKHIDVLPVHYSDMSGVLEARADLDSVGLKQTPVWDNETSRGLSTWNMPLREMLQIRNQSQWVLERWPDELTAGAEAVIFFGGQTDPAGNWSYLLDESTPRPVAATIAVLASKLAGAKPLGRFSLGQQGVCHLFERDGKAILVAGSAAEKGETVTLYVGGGRVVATDFQGSETPVPSPGGRATLTLEPMRVIVEGADLDVLKTQVAVSIGDNPTVTEPRVVLAGGAAGQAPSVRIRNVYGRPLRGTLALALPAGWPAGAPKPFTIAPGREETIPVPLQIPAGASGDFALKAQVRFADTKLPAVEKPFGVTLVSADMVGNLLRNGGFEEAGASETTAAGWTLGKGGKRHPGGGGLGTGSYVLRYENSPEYDHATQTVKAPAGQSYLYTAWVWNQDMQAGSNISHVLADGTTKNFYIPAVFDAGMQSPYWKLVSTRTNTPPNLKEIAFTPVVRGAGWAMLDNLRVTLYEGTNYAAESHRAKSPVKIDGRLDEWVKKSPIPLLAHNQLTAFDKAYRWTPENLGGVAYLMWDEGGLYFAAEVRDDTVSATATGDDTLTGDSLALAVHPANRAAGTDERAFVYYLSAASPGGGSGRSTLYRPAAHAGGLPAGHLAKDSSVYDFSIRREGDVTTYEVRIPWQELGGINPAFGAKFGLSLLLNDNDGAGRAAAMSWGDGLLPAWSPANFGVVTLVNE